MSATCWPRVTCPLWDKMAAPCIWCSRPAPYAADWPLASNLVSKPTVRMRISKWKITVASVLLVPAFLWATRYRTNEFKGGVSIQDSGIWYYPEYHVRIGYVPLDAPGEYRFTVRGLPSEHMWLQLDVVGASLSDQQTLRSLNTSLTATLLNASGKSLCSASGQLSDEGKWKLTGWPKDSKSDGYASFWNESCAPSNSLFEGVSISRFRTYTLVVRVSEVSPHSPKLIVEPVFKGGG